jgi:hypothetical protein
MILRQLVFAISAFALFTTGASAADMPVKAPRVVEQPPQVMGYVEVYGGWARTKRDDTECFPECFTFSEKTSGWALGGAGRATWWWAPNYSVQLDAQGEGTSYKFTSGNFFARSSSHSYLIGGHANWRDPGRGLIGIFGGAGDATNFENFESVRHGLIGGEAQVYWGPVTLYGQVGYDSTLGSISSRDGNIDSFHAWFVRGTARFYVNPNFRLEGTVLYADGEVDHNPSISPVTEDFTTWLWRGKAEYKFASSPFSIFAAYEGSQTKFHVTRAFGTGTEKLTDNRILAGIRLYINENTLQWNDRNGTTLDIIAPLNVPSTAFVQGAQK